MQAVCWNGKHDVRVETGRDPAVLDPRDAIVRITSTAICGSDLHLYGGHIRTLEQGDILGHEFMGEVVEVGSENRALIKGDRVVVPFVIACGCCFGSCVTRVQRPAAVATARSSYLAGNRPNDGLTWCSLHSGYT
jgi:threonine dehydrogenase-like Zn-dependent dehydrogenase